MYHIYWISPLYFSTIYTWKPLRYDFSQMVQRSSSYLHGVLRALIYINKLQGEMTMLGSWRQKKNFELQWTSAMTNRRHLS